MIGNSTISQKIAKHVMLRKSPIDKFMPLLLLATAFVSVLVTVGIVVILSRDAIYFFQQVPLLEVFSSSLKPLSATPSFGFLPIIFGSLITSGIAMMVALPLGLAAALYLSEFASDLARTILKPLLELLAGIPTIVYGFFAYRVVTPLLFSIIPHIEAKNVLSPGIVMGIMIIPMVASLSEDAMRSVPNDLREGALGLGATKLEVAVKVVLPAAFSGIMAALVLAISRAIGETMIVAIASGSSKQLTFDITESMQTMTGYIVEFTSGDAASGTTGYYSLYAVGLVLFCFTLIINLGAHWLAARYREEY